MPEPRVALVLGAGGITGGAFELGMLAALAERTGWNPAQARAFIGTSAGSSIAAMLASGRIPADMQTAPPPAAPSGNVARRAGRRLANAALGDTSDLYTPDLRRRSLSPFWWARPGGLLAESGLFSSAGMEQRLRARLGDAADGWPHSALRIVAFDTRTHSRTVFGAAGAPPATALQAVTASSAIPGVFRPVVINGMPYLDGGVVSTTHLDLAGEFAAEIDLAICLAPMAGEQLAERPPAGAGVYGYALTEALAWVARRQVDEEAARLRSAHPAIDVLVLRPNADDRRTMGNNAMAGSKREPVRRQAYLSGLFALAQDEVRETLAKHGLAPV